MLVNLSKAPAFQRIKEGVQTLRITEVTTFPNRKNAVPTEVTVQFEDENGTKLSKKGNKYDLTKDGGYSAFYYLVTVGAGLDPSQNVDVQELVGKFVEVDIVHTEVEYPKLDENRNPIEGQTVTLTFSNIHRVLGEGTPFEVADDGDDIEDDYDL